MIKDSGVKLSSLKVDGGMTQSSLTLQIQADLIGIPVGQNLSHFIFSIILLFFHLMDQ